MKRWMIDVILMKKDYKNRQKSRPIGPLDICGNVNDPNGFAKRFINREIGFGIFSTKKFSKHETLLEYKGTICGGNEGKLKLENYRKRKLGSYIFFFKSNGKRVCIDATLDSHLAKYVNDAPEGHYNCKMKRIQIKNKDHLYLEASQDIPANTELRYSYNAPDLTWRENEENHYPYVYNEVLGKVEKGSRNIVEESGTNILDTSKSLFVKVEDISKSYKPLYQHFDESAKRKFKSFQKTIENNTDAREVSFEIEKEPSEKRYKRSDFCELCDCQYGNLEQHLETKQHEDKKSMSNYGDIDKEINELSLSGFIQKLQPSVSTDLCSTSNETIPILFQVESLKNIATEKIQHYIINCANDIAAAVTTNCKANELLKQRNMVEEKSAANSKEKKDQAKYLEVCKAKSCVPASGNIKRPIKKTYKRRKPICPKCNTTVPSLPKHLRDKHGSSEIDSLRISKAVSLRRKMEKSPKKNDHHYYFRCPLDWCGAIIKRKSDHFTTKHPDVKGSEYYSLLKKAKRFHYSEIANELSPKKFADASVNTSPQSRKNFDEKENGKKNNDKRVDFQALPNEPIPSITLEEVITAPPEHVNVSQSTPMKPHIQAASFQSSTCTTPIDSPSINGDCSASIDGDSSFILDARDIMSEREIDLPLSTEIEKLLADFHLFLNGPDGGHLTNSKEIVGEVRRIFKSINIKSIQDIFLKNKLRDQYLGDVCKKMNYQADTIRKYLLSLVHFITFLIIDEIKIENITQDQMINFKLRVSNWRIAYKDDAKKQKWLREVRDMEYLVTPDQVQQYENSEHATNAKAILTTISDDPETVISMKDFCNCRDYVFGIIAFHNAHRSGVLANVTMEEFSRAKQEESGHVSILVAKHKTFATTGPASITLPLEQFKHMENFVKYVRPKSDPKDQNVFLSWNGVAMQSGSVSRQVDSMFTKAGVYDINDKKRKKLCFNLIRKGTVSGLLDKNIGDVAEQETADIMGHSRSTQHKHYFIRKKQITAARACDRIKNFYSGALESPSKRFSSEETKLLSTSFSEELDNDEVHLDDVKSKLKNININKSPIQVYKKLKQLSKKHYDNPQKR